MLTLLQFRFNLNFLARQAQLLVLQFVDALADRFGQS